MNKYFYFVIVCFLFSFISIDSDENEKKREEYLNSNVSEKEFNESKWVELTKDLDYTTEVEEKPEIKSNNSNFKLPAWTALAAKFILIAVVIGLLTFLVLKIINEGKGIKNKKIVRKKNTGFELEKATENIHEVDLDSLLNKAISGNDFRLAIRIYYLIVLKKLSSLSLIKWKKDKTNAEYLGEMSKNSGFNSFQGITLTFEKVWYGRHEVSEQEYENVVPVFNEFINSLQKQEQKNQL